MLTVLEARTVDGSWCVQYDNLSPGMLVSYKSPADAFVDYLRRITGNRNIVTVLGLNMSQFYKIRAGTQAFNEAWILWGHEVSGAPIASLRIITNTRSKAP